MSSLIAQPSCREVHPSIDELRLEVSPPKSLETCIPLCSVWQLYTVPTVAASVVLSRMQCVTRDAPPVVAVPASFSGSVHIHIRAMVSRTVALSTLKSLVRLSAPGAP